VTRNTQGRHTACAVAPSLSDTLADCATQTHSVRANCSSRRHYIIKALLPGFAAWLPPSSPRIPCLVQLDDRRLPFTWRGQPRVFGGCCAMMPLKRRWAAEALPIRWRQSEESAAAKQRTPFRREPDSAAHPPPFWSYSGIGMVFATRVRLCGCASRSYPSHSTSQLHEIMGARHTTRTRQVHAASSWYRSRTGISVPCAQKYLSKLAHSDGKRTSRRSLATRAASAGRYLRTTQPTSCMFVVLYTGDACTQLAAAESLLE
jgi:hypothetical protein